MKPYLLLISIVLFASSTLVAQKTTRVNAIKANNYGVTYSLPKTSFEVTLLVKKTTHRKGEFYQYAQRYLGITDPIVDDKVVFTVEEIAIANVGVPDKENSFMVEFHAKSSEPFVYLREDGVIVSINANPETETPQAIAVPQGKLSLSNARNYLSQEALMAGSTAKQAELVARQIFGLRSNRSDILSGEAENMPPDGNAYKMVLEEISLQEKALTEMFSGSEDIEYFTRTYSIVPDQNDIDRRIIARFSEKLGPVDADNLAGEPIYFSLVNKTPIVETQLSERDLQKMENKLTTGIVYNVPGKAGLTVEFKNKTFVNKEVDVTQYGTQDVLVRKMFDSKQPIKIYFYPELGAIQQIIQ